MMTSMAARWCPPTLSCSVSVPPPPMMSSPRCASSPRLRARSSSGNLSITCTKDAPELNAHQWLSFKWGRKKRQSILYSWACGMTCVGVWLVHAHAAYTIPYCVSPASPAGSDRRFDRARGKRGDRSRTAARFERGGDTTPASLPAQT